MVFAGTRVLAALFSRNLHSGSPLVSVVDNFFIFLGLGLERLGRAATRRLEVESYRGVVAKFTV